MTFTTNLPIEVAELLSALGDWAIVAELDGSVLWSNGECPDSALRQTLQEVTSVQAFFMQHGCELADDLSNEYLSNPPYHVLKIKTQNGQSSRLYVGFIPLKWQTKQCVLLKFKVKGPELALLKQLEETRDLLDKSQSIAKLGTWDWDIASNSLAWSAQLFEMFGIPQNKFAASYEAFTNTIHPEDRHKVDNAVSDALESQKPYLVTHRIIRPDGSVRIVKEMGKVYRDNNGHPIRMIGTAQDISEEHLQRVALQEAHEEIASHQEELENLAYRPLII